LDSGISQEFSSLLLLPAAGLGALAFFVLSPTFFISIAFLVD
jgi:hypothetical protein